MKAVRAVLTLFFLLLLTPFAYASDTFQDANRAYAGGNLEEAVKLYTQALSEQGWSPGILYNMGNAYAMLGRPGEAVLAYKRALYLRPRDDDAAANLTQTLKEAGTFPDEPSRAKALITAFSMNRLAYAALASAGVLALYLLMTGVLPFIRLKAGLIKSPPGPMNIFIAAVCVLIIVVAGAGTAVQLYQLKEAVVLADDASLQVSPFQGAGHRSSLKPGRIVEIIKEFQEYYYIEDANGQTGWLKKDSAARVVPG